MAVNRYLSTTESEKINKQAQEKQTQTQNVLAGPDGRGVGGGAWVRRVRGEEHTLVGTERSRDAKSRTGNRANGTNSQAWGRMGVRCLGMSTREVTRCLIAGDTWCSIVCHLPLKSKSDFQKEETQAPAFRYHGCRPGRKDSGRWAHTAPRPSAEGQAAARTLASAPPDLRRTHPDPPLPRCPGGALMCAPKARALAAAGAGRRKKRKTPRWPPQCPPVQTARGACKVGNPRKNELDLEGLGWKFPRRTLGGVH